MNSPQPSGVELIAAERRRQIEKEGYSPAHDDAHTKREIACAGLAYVGLYVRRAWVYTNELELPAVVDGPARYQSEEAPDEWPWDIKDWKPQDPLRDLIKAGALIAAEIDRLNRKAVKEKEGTCGT